LFKTSPEFFGIMLSLMEKLNLFAFPMLSALAFFTPCQMFSEVIGRPALGGHCPFALAMLFGFGVSSAWA